MKSKVKLHIYEDHGKETVVDIFEAREWDDFLLVAVDMPMSQEQVDQLNQAFGSIEKRVVVIPYGVPVKFYGIRESDDQPIELTAAPE